MKTDLQIAMELLKDLYEDYRVTMVRNNLKPNQYTEMILGETEDFLKELNY